MSDSGTDAGDAQRRDDLAAWTRAMLAERLETRLGEQLRPQGKRPRDGAGWVDVSAHDLTAACPSRWSVPFDDFVPSVTTASGALGRLALRERRDGEPVGEAVARVAETLGDADPAAAWFASWYDQELDRAGRAALRSGATTWAVGALASVRGRSLSWSTARERHCVADRAIRLSSTWDASTGGARPEVLVVVTPRSPSEPATALVAGFNALVNGLVRGRMPARVRIASAATASSTSFPVTEELLEPVVDRVVELVGWRVDRDAAPTVPGRWCRNCHLLDVCPVATPG